MERSLQEHKNEVVKRIEELSYIVNGLENHDPFIRLLKLWEGTKKSIDDTWHLVGDFNKLAELRITKMAAVDLIRIVPNMKHDLEMLQKQLIELDNPDQNIKKDYDEE